MTPWSLVSLTSGPTSVQQRPRSSHEQITLETVAYAEGSSSLHPVACPFPPSASTLLDVPAAYRPTLFCALRSTTYVRRRAWPQNSCRVTTRFRLAIYAFSTSDSSSCNPHHGATGIHISIAPDLPHGVHRQLPGPAHTQTPSTTPDGNKIHAGYPFHPGQRRNLDPGGVSVTPGFGGALPSSWTLSESCMSSLAAGRHCSAKGGFPYTCVAPASSSSAAIVWSLIHQRSRLRAKAFATSTGSPCPVFHTAAGGWILVSSFQTVFDIRLTWAVSCCYRRRVFSSIHDSVLGG